MTIEDTQRELIETVLAVPLHRSLGLRPIDPGDMTAGVELDAHAAALNPSRVLHGAVAPLMMDVACYLAVMADLEPGANAVTVSIACSLLAAVPEGGTVQARGRIDRRGRGLAHMTASVHEGDRLVATAQVVKALVPPA
ncbi:MAG TPA: PaaI family thioesterase [Conexibacter sp.]|nr:PaaI family thioesterase [Conexibacter sp.]